MFIPHFFFFILSLVFSIFFTHSIFYFYFYLLSLSSIFFLLLLLLLNSIQFFTFFLCMLMLILTVMHKRMMMLFNFSHLPSSKVDTSFVCSPTSWNLCDWTSAFCAALKAHSARFMNFDCYIKAPLYIYVCYIYIYVYILWSAEPQYLRLNIHWMQSHMIYYI